MGLFDFYDDPEQAARLAFGAGLLSMGGPSLRPISTGQAIAGGLMASQQAGSEAAMNKRRDAYMQAQTANILAQQQGRDLEAQKQLAIFRMLGIPVSAAPGTTPGAPVPGVAQAGAGQPSAPAVPSPQGPAAQAPATQDDWVRGLTPGQIAGLQYLDPQAFKGLPELNKVANEGYKLPTGHFRVPGGPPQYRPEVNVTSDGKATQTDYDPATGRYRVSTPQGAQEVYAGFESVKALINAASTLKEFQGPDGQARLASVLSILQNGGGQPAPQGPRQAPPTTGYMSPEQQRQGVEQFRQGATTPEGAQDIAGYNPVPGMPAGPTPTVKGSQEVRAKLNEDFIKTEWPATRTKADNAGSILTSVGVARKALAGAGSGWSTNLRAGAANVLSGLGIAPDKVQDFASNAQIFQQAASTRLWEVLNDAKGPQTEGDADRAKATFAQLANTPKANEFILDLAQAVAERDRKKWAFYQRARNVAEARNDMSELSREWSLRAPSVFDMPSMEKWRK